MVPAGQGLAPHHLEGVHVGEKLEVELDLLLGDGLGEVLQQGPALPAGGALAGGAGAQALPLPAGPAGALARVEQGVAEVVVLGGQGEHPRPGVLEAQAPGAGAELCEDILGPLGGLLGGGGPFEGQQVLPPAGQDVGAAGGLPENLAPLAQGLLGLVIPPEAADLLQGQVEADQAVGRAALVPGDAGEGIFQLLQGAQAGLGVGGDKLCPALFSPAQAEQDPHRRGQGQEQDQAPPQGPGGQGLGGGVPGGLEDGLGPLPLADGLHIGPQVTLHLGGGHLGEVQGVVLPALPGEEEQGLPRRMGVGTARLASGDHVHLLVFRQLLPQVLLPGAEVAQVVAVLLGEGPEKIGDGPLVGAAFGIVIFRGVQVRVPRHVDDGALSFQTALLSPHWNRVRLCMGAAAYTSFTCSSAWSALRSSSFVMAWRASRRAAMFSR